MKVLAVILLLVVTSASADDAAGVCAGSCVGPGSAAQYEAGMMYTYSYQGRVMTKAVVAGEEESTLSVSAQVIIIANTPCDLKLQVADLVVEEADEDAKWFSEAVQEHDLHFSYKHGAITDLCPHEEEEAVATNFKRGILSSLQMSVSPGGRQGDVVISEVDVSGECDTQYSMKTEPALQVTKTRLGCHTASHLPHLPHSHYTNTKPNNQLPFTKG